MEKRRKKRPGFWLRAKPIDFGREQNNHSESQTGSARMAEEFHNLEKGIEEKKELEGSPQKDCTKKARHRGLKPARQRMIKLRNTKRSIIIYRRRRMGVRGGGR